MDEEHKKHSRWLYAGAIAIALITLLLLLYWLIWGRFFVSTTDAYVNGNQIVVTSQISGFVQTVAVQDTQLVAEGDLLVHLDPTDSIIALEKAKSSLGEAVRQVIVLQQRVSELQAEKQVRLSDFIRAGQDYVHRENVVEEGGVSREDFEHAEAAFVSAFASTLMVEHALRAAAAQVENTTLETHPLVLSAEEELRAAYVNLKRCHIVSPVRGIVAQKRAQVGESILPADPLMAVIPLDQMWVDANFKENQLKKVRLGQKVRLWADLYGRFHSFHGTVIGISAGTGSVFSLLPPQNATGNWIKIVQRLPVRIEIDPAEIRKLPLRLGLSMNVKIDLGEEGPMVPAPFEGRPLFNTPIFEEQLSGADELIQQIIKDNS